MKRRSDQMLKITSTKDEPQNSKGIRTRLSTGTLVMSGTSTASPSDFHFRERSSSPSNTSSAGSDASHQTADSTSPTSRKRKFADKEYELGEQSNTPPKRKKIGRNDGTGEGNKNDYFCWICHKEGVVICCELCPRVFHAKCLNIENNVPQDWVCPECEKLMKAECTDTRSKTMATISVGTLCTLLRYALDRMRTVGSETFEQLVDTALFPNYSDYVFHPMSLSLLEKNIKRKNYGCTESFLADAKWIYHNSVVYNGAQNKITLVARALLKVCKHEMSEIEVCPDCYYNSCLQSDRDWFCEPCRTPHLLVWAKLKGYPFWPAKALREVNDQVDVRFFGAHDRSWVPVASCFMLSKVCPVTVKKGRSGMIEAMREVDVHIKKLRENLGSFDYAPFRTPYTSDATVCYSRFKNNSSSSGESSKHTGYGKMAGKSKAGDGRHGEKHSNVSKTAMALKSKYIGMSSKKGMQPPGTVVKLIGSTPQQQQRQIIFLKPILKGVFLLSGDQSIEDVALSSTQGGVLRSGVPDLQLAKPTSNKEQSSVSSSSSKSVDGKDVESSLGCNNAKDTLTKGQASREEEQVDIVMETGGDGSTESGATTAVKITQESLENSLSLNNLQDDLVSKNIETHQDDLNSENIETHQDGLVSKNIETHQDGLVSKNIETHQDDLVSENIETHQDDLNSENIETHQDDLFSKNIETHQDDLNSENIETHQDDLVSKNIKTHQDDLNSKNIETHQDDLNSKNIETHQDDLISKDVAMDVDASATMLKDPESELISSHIGVALANKNSGEGNSNSQELAIDVDASATMLNNPESELISSPADVELEEKSNEGNGSSQDLRLGRDNQQKQTHLDTDSLIRTADTDSLIRTADTDSCDGEGILSPNLASSVLSTVIDNRMPIPSEHTLKSSNADVPLCTNSPRDDINSNVDLQKEACSSFKLIAASDSSISNFLHGGVKESSKQTQMSNNCDTTSVDLNSVSVTEGNVVLSDSGDESLLCEKTGDIVDKRAAIEPPSTCGDAEESSSYGNSSKVSISHVREGNLTPAEGDKNVGTAQLTRQSGDCLHSESIPSSSSSSLSSSLAVSASSVSSSLTSVVSLSPGSKYKESLQKVIDSCKAKLGIDNKTLNNTDADALILDGDNDDADIVISDNDSDVMLMDISDDNDEHINPAPTKTIQKSSNSSSKEVLGIYDGAVQKNNTNKNTQHLNISLQASETPNKEPAPSSNKDIPYKPALDNLNEPKNNVQEKQLNINKPAISSEISEIASSKIASPFKEIASERNTSKTTSTYRGPSASLLEDHLSTIVCSEAVSLARDKSTDIGWAGRQTISQQPAPKNRKSLVSKATSRVWPEIPDNSILMGQQVVTGAKKSSTSCVDESVINVPDDDDDDEDDDTVSCADDMTLDMEVVCADDPREDSDGDIEMNNESSGDEVSIADSRNWVKQSSIVSRVDNPVQYVDKTPVTTSAAANVELSRHPPQDILTTSISYPANRGTSDLSRHPPQDILTTSVSYPAIRGTSDLSRHPPQDILTTSVSYPAIRGTSDLSRHPPQDILTTSVSYPAIQGTSDLSRHPPQDILTTSVSHPAILTLAPTSSSTGIIYKGHVQLDSSKARQMLNPITASIASSSSADKSAADPSTHINTLHLLSSGRSDITILPHQKNRPRILISKLKRKTPATVTTSENTTVVSLDDFEDGSDVDGNGGTTVISRKFPCHRKAITEVRQIVESDVEELTSIADEEGSSLADPDRRGRVEEDVSNPSVVLKDKLKSIVEDRYSLFENFLKDQLNDMAEEVKKVTEQAVPHQVEHSKQKSALLKQTKEYNRKAADICKTMDRTLKEALASFKLQKAALADKLKEEFGKELQNAIANTKKQQWCAECWKEAVYYCCWNTSYCSYQCQQKHWPSHMLKCMQTQPQQAATQVVSRSPKIISTLNTLNGTSKGTTSITSNNTVPVTACATQPTTSAGTVSKIVQRLPTVSIVSPSQWKASEETAKGKKMFSLVSPQSVSNTTAPINTLSIGPSHFQIQYLQQQGTPATLPQQVQVVGGNHSSIPILMSNQVTAPVQLLHNAPMFPLMQRPTQQTQHQQAQQIGATRYILPSNFGSFMRPGGPV